MGSGSAVVKVEQGASHSTHRGQTKKNLCKQNTAVLFGILLLCAIVFITVSSYKPPHSILIEFAILSRLKSIYSKDCHLSDTCTYVDFVYRYASLRISNRSKFSSSIIVTARVITKDTK